jgi:glutamine amidotransferase
MRRLRVAGLVDVICNLQQPVLGVCLGMQLLFEHSEEGDTACLGVFPGRVRRIQGSAKLRVPHMGWNRLRVRRDDSVFSGIDDGAYAYFVHGYAAPKGEATIATVAHGGEWSAIVRRGNFVGMQFHPERSAAVGARLLGNFLAS